ncbi:MAG: extracellular solute-binding protein [Opitutales bacterium]
MAHKVFISFSKNDKLIADAVCARFEGKGIPCWIAPRDVVPGESWPKQIVSAISEASVVILVFSSSSNESEHVSREVHQAVTEGKTIIPLRIERLSPGGNLAYYLSTTHWLEAIDPPMEEKIEELSQVVIAALKGGKGSATQEPKTPDPGPKPKKKRAADLEFEKRAKARKKRFIWGSSIVAVLLVCVVLFLNSFSQPVVLGVAGNFDGKFGNAETRETQMESFNLDLSNQGLANLEVVLDYNDPALDASQTVDDPLHQNVSELLRSILLEFERNDDFQPEIMELDHHWLQLFAESGKVVSLQEFDEIDQLKLSSGLREKAASVLLPEGGNTGLLVHAIPYYTSVSAIMVRGDHVKEDPESWEDFVELFLELRQQEQYKDWTGVVIQGANYEGFMCNLLEFLWARGGNIAVPNRKKPPHVNNAKMIETVEWIREMVEIQFIDPASFRARDIQKGTFGLNEKSSERHFAQGKSFAMRNWTTSLQRFDEGIEYPNMGSVRPIARPLSFKSSFEDTGFSALGGAMYAITPYALEKGTQEAAAEIISFLVSEKYQRRRSLEKSIMPDGRIRTAIRVPVIDSVLDEVYQQNDALKYARNVFVNGMYRNRPQMVTYPAVSSILTTQIHKYLNEEEYGSAKEALDVAQAMIEELYVGDPVQNTIDYILK